MKWQRIFVLCLSVSSSVAWGQLTTPDSMSNTMTWGIPTERLFHVQGSMTLHGRYTPGGAADTADQTLTTFGVSVHWQPKTWLSFGPLFRGLSTLDSGTDTTRVTNTLNAFGASVSLFPFGSSLFDSGSFYVRMVLSGGILYNIERITFSHDLIVTNSLTKSVSSWVFPLEVGSELIVMKNITFRTSMGYTFFAQSQNVYAGLGIGFLM